MQRDPGGYRLKFASDSGKFESKNTASGLDKFDKDVSEALADQYAGALVFHVGSEGSFGELEPFLARIVELGERAKMPVLVSALSLGEVQVEADCQELPASIGMASMDGDGTIVLQLRATDATGRVGDGLLRYPTNHPDYRKVLNHLGGLEPDQEKPVPPFPEKW